MPTNLLIGFPRYTTEATSVTSPYTLDASNPLTNLISGQRGSFCQLGATSNTWYIDFAFPTLRPMTIDYFYIARANLLKAQGATRFNLQAYDGLTYVSLAGTFAGVPSLTLYGPRAEDAIFTSELANSQWALPVTGNYSVLRYRPCGTADPVSKWKHSKMMCGPWLDLGRDPVAPREISRVVRDKGNREAAYRFRFTWRGISDAKRNEFLAFLSEKQNGCILYTRSYHELLLNFRVVHCQVLEYSHTYREVNNNEFDVTFEEMI